MENIKELFVLIADGMSYKFNIFGYNLSMMNIFIYGTLGSILIGFLGGIINGKE